MYIFRYDTITKTPAECQWNLSKKNKISKNSDLECYNECYGAVGIVLTKEMLVVDVDPRNGGTESLLKLENIIKEKLYDCCACIVKTGGGGTHYYFQKSPLLSIRKSSKPFPGIDFLTFGQNTVAPNSKIEVSYYKKNGKYTGVETGKYFYIKGDVFNLSSAPLSLTELIRKEDRDILVPSKNKKLTQDQRATVFANLDPIKFRDYDNWLRLMFSSKKAGSSLEEFIEWCSRDEKYDCDEEHKKIKKLWENAKIDQITHKTFLHYFDENGGNQNSLICNSEIKKFTAVQGKNRSKLSDWVYVEDQEKFYNIKANYFNTIGGLRTTLSYCLNGRKITDVLNQNLIDRVIGFRFLPGQGKIVQDGNYKYINKWIPPTLIPKKGDIKPYLEFIYHFWGEDSEKVLDWMALIAQGKRPRYMLIIHSFKNQVGKSSLIGGFMKSLCGASNVSSVTGKVIESDYNGYLDNSHLIIIEELYAGNKKLQVYNSIKEQITEQTLMINAKYMRPYKIKNQTVYLAFTNYPDSLLIVKNDPRVLFVSTHKEPFPHSKYCQLHHWCKEDGFSYLYQYLLKRDVKGMTYSHAPQTKSKNEMAHASKTEEEMFLDDEVFDKNKDNHSHDFICLKTLRNSFVGNKISYRKTSQVLRRKGYRPKTIFIDGRVRNIYYSNDLAKRLEFNDKDINRFIRENFKSAEKGYKSIDY